MMSVSPLLDYSFFKNAHELEHDHICNLLHEAKNEPSDRIWAQLCTAAGFRILTEEQLRRWGSHQRYFEVVSEIFREVRDLKPDNYKSDFGAKGSDLNSNIIQNLAEKIRNENQPGLWYTIMVRCAPIARYLPSQKHHKRHCEECGQTYGLPQLMQKFLRRRKWTLICEAKNGNGSFLERFFQSELFAPHLTPKRVGKILHSIHQSALHLRLTQLTFTNAPLVEIQEAVLYAQCSGQVDVAHQITEQAQKIFPEFDETQLAQPVFDHMCHGEIEHLDLFELYCNDPALRPILTSHAVNQALHHATHKIHFGSLRALFNHVDLINMIASSSVFFNLQYAIQKQMFDVIDLYVACPGLIERIAPADQGTLVQQAKDAKEPKLMPLIQALVNLQTT